MLFRWFSRILHAVVFLVLLLIFSYTFAPFLVEASPISNAYINEIHYDNIGKDIDEFIEITGDGSIDLTGWSLHLYTGSNGSEYNSFNLDKWSNIDPVTKFGFLAIDTKNLQNGSADGIVLFDGKNVIQFLSYEGSFIATNSVAVGLKSVDIGVSESSTSKVGFSLQLAGIGGQYSDFTWSEAKESTYSANNIEQSFINKSFIVKVSEPNGLFTFYFFLFVIYSIVSKSKLKKQIVG